MKKEDKYSYEGWLISDCFIKRAFAVWGHMVVAQLITAITLSIILIILVFIFSGFFNLADLSVR